MLLPELHSELPASDVWRVKGRLASFARVLDDPHERLLADLGRASRLSPELEEALQVAKPVELSLDVQAAYRFLQESVPLLAEAGFGVIEKSLMNHGYRNQRVSPIFPIICEGFQNGTAPSFPRTAQKARQEIRGPERLTAGRR